MNPRKRRQREVRGAADAGLEHPAAPHGHAGGPAQVVDRDRGVEAPHAAGLDRERVGRAQVQREPGVVERRDRLVEADDGGHAADEGVGVVEQVAGPQGLLEQLDVERGEHASTSASE